MCRMQAANEPMPSLLWYDGGRGESQSEQTVPAKNGDADQNNGLISEYLPENRATLTWAGDEGSFRRSTRKSFAELRAPWKPPP